MAGNANILVTGGTGFIGRHVVRLLIRQGVCVRLLCRTPEKADRLFGAAATVVQGDLLDPASLAPACRGVETVLNLGGWYEFGARHRQALWATNVLGTNHLLAAAWHARVERVVHCSTAGILTASADAAAPPRLPAQPPRGCHYKHSKWHGERLALDWARRGLPVMIASPTAPIGAEDERPTPTGRMIVDLLAGRFPCYSATGLNVIAVTDVALGILAIARQGRAGQRYVLANRNIWLGDFLRLAAAAVSVKAPRLVAPWPLIALGGALGELWGLATGAGNGRLCWETAYFARQRQFFELARCVEGLAWTPVKPIEDAVADAAAWVLGQQPRSAQNGAEAIQPQAPA
jgi:dihydroflavonol-4-reductase